LAEEEVGGLGNEEEFGDDGANAAEVAGADGAFEEVGQWAGVDGGAEGGVLGAELGDAGVHFLGGGDEDGIAAGGVEEGAVIFEAARVAGEIFAGSELGGVDKDGGEDAAGGTGELAGLVKQGDVAFVERAHGGDEGDDGGGVGGAPGAEVVNRVKDFHVGHDGVSSGEGWWVMARRRGRVIRRWICGGWGGGRRGRFRQGVRARKDVHASAGGGG